MKFFIILLISLLLLTACEDKGYGTEDITNIPSITSNDKVQILTSTPKEILAQKAYIAVKFSSYMSIESLNSSNIYLQDLNNSLNINLEIDAKENYLYIKPLSSLLPSIAYKLTLKSSITDILGNTLNRDYTHTYTCRSNFWQSVKAGSSHSMAKSIEGDLFIWGSNANNQILDDSTSRSIPLGIIGLENVKDYSAGYNSSSIIKSDETLFSIGTLSISDTSSTNLKTISSGYNHTSFIKNDGTLWSWGDNDNGQIGNLSLTSQILPTQEYYKYTNWTKLSAGENFTIALRDDNTLWGWGDNTYGQIGDTLYKRRLTPTQEDSNTTTWSKLSAGGFHSVMLKENGTLWSLGKNDSGQLGDASNTTTNSPTQEDTNSTNWTKLSAGYNHTCAINTLHELWCWGNNIFGQLGINNTINQNAPIKVGTDNDWYSISAGKYFTLATKENGTLWAWGNNTNFQLGLGININNNIVPILIPTEVK